MGILLIFIAFATLFPAGCHTGSKRSPEPELPQVTIDTLVIVPADTVIFKDTGSSMIFGTSRDHH